jgi:hypothetical protein
MPRASVERAGRLPRNSPLCVPRSVNRITTRSPASKISSMSKRMLSGIAARTSQSDRARRSRRGCPAMSRPDRAAQSLGQSPPGQSGNVVVADRVDQAPQRCHTRAASHYGSSVARARHSKTSSMSKRMSGLAARSIPIRSRTPLSPRMPGHVSARSCRTKPGPITPGQIGQCRCC